MIFAKGMHSLFNVPFIDVIDYTEGNFLSHSEVQVVEMIQGKKLNAIFPGHNFLGFVFEYQ